jgi:uncharacterized protein (TIGR02594 family)
MQETSEPIVSPPKETNRFIENRIFKSFDRMTDDLGHEVVKIQRIERNSRFLLDKISTNLTRINMNFTQTLETLARIFNLQTRAGEEIAERVRKTSRNEAVSKTLLSAIISMLIGAVLPKILEGLMKGNEDGDNENDAELVEGEPGLDRMEILFQSDKGIVFEADVIRVQGGTSSALELEKSASPDATKVSPTVSSNTPGFTTANGEAVPAGEAVPSGESASETPSGDGSPKSDGPRANQGKTDTSQDKLTSQEIIARAMKGDKSIPDRMMDRALKLEGMTEIEDRQAIQSYLRNGGKGVDPARTAWCADFINATLAQEGMKGTGSAVANSFSNWGVGVKSSDSKKGDVLVEHRGRGAGQTGGHVGFATGESRINPRTGRRELEMYGGNQGVKGRGSIAANKKWVDADAVHVRRAPAVVEEDAVRDKIKKGVEPVPKAPEVKPTPEAKTPEVKPTPEAKTPEAKTPEARPRPTPAEVEKQETSPAPAKKPPIPFAAGIPKEVPEITPPANSNKSAMPAIQPQQQSKPGLGMPSIPPIEIPPAIRKEREEEARRPAPEIVGPEERKEYTAPAPIKDPEDERWSQPVIVR